jgi:Tfp pilus assembly protein PilF
MRATRVLVAALAAWGLGLPPAAEAFRNVEVGDRVPPLTLADAEGRPIAVPQAGRATIVLFSRPGQQLSDEATADLGGLARGLAAKGLDIVTVMPAAAGRAMPRRQEPAPVRALVDESGRAQQAYGVIVYPSTAVVGADGTLVYYLPSRAAGYRGLVEAHALRAVGEISQQELSARVAQAGGAPATGAERGQAAYRKGMLLVGERRLDEAAASFEEAVAAAPRFLDARLQLGYIRLDLDQPAPAIRQFEAALAISPGSPAARMGVGIARVRLGETEEGIRILSEAVRLNPEPVRGHYELGRAHETRGDYSQAAEQYRWALVKLLQGRK